MLDDIIMDFLYSSCNPLHVISMLSCQQNLMLLSIRMMQVLLPPGICLCDLPHPVSVLQSLMNAELLSLQTYNSVISLGCYFHWLFLPQFILTEVL